MSTNQRDRTLVLSIKSANGIYTLIDRKQMQNQFDELNSEQLRISTLFKKSIPKKGQSNISLLTQAEAEKAMLNLMKLNT
jgi:5-methylcytosine-specific restriction endonuclease McrBC GTP-binding regulatory subunit McrB